MAIGVTFPENEDVVAFGRKNEMLVLLVSKLGIYQKELGNYAGYWLRKRMKRFMLKRNADFTKCTCHRSPSVKLAMA